MKRILFLMLGALIMLSGCSKSEFNFEDGVLVVGLEAAYAPFNWMETEPSDTNYPLAGLDSYVEGYDVQIAKLLANDLNLELVIKMVDWEGMVIALQSGMIDVIIAGMSPTPERLEQISFTDPYYQSEHVVIVNKDGNYNNATDFEDFNGAKIIGQKGTIYDTLAKQLVDKNIDAKYQNPLASVPEIVNAIKTGVSDVTVVEKPVAISVVNNNNDLKYIELATPFTVDEDETIVSIGVRKQDNNLLEALNKALSKISLETREELMFNASNVAPEE